MLKHLDLFGKKASLNFGGKHKSASNIGGAVSVLFIAFLIWLTFHVGKDMIQRQNPQTITSESLKEDPDAMALGPDTFSFGFGLQHPDTYAHYIDETIYTVEAFIRQLSRVKNDTGDVIMQWNNIPIELETCRTDHFGSLGPKFETLDLKNLYCIKKEQSQLDQLRIQGALESSTFEYIWIKIKPCNSQTSNVSCVSNDTLNYMLAGGWFAVYFTNLAIDPTNYGSPATHYRDSYRTSVGNIFYKEITMWLSHFQVSTDSGWLLENTEKEDFIEYDNTQEIINFRQDMEQLIDFNVRVDKINTYYQRSYIKIQDIFANVDGLSTVVLIVAAFFVSPYSKMKFYEGLINDLFDIKILKSGKKKHIKGKGTEKADSLERSDTPGKEQERGIPKSPNKTKQKIEVAVHHPKKEATNLDISCSQGDLLPDQSFRQTLDKNTEQDIKDQDINTLRRKKAILTKASTVTTELNGVEGTKKSSLELVNQQQDGDAPIEKSDLAKNSRRNSCQPQFFVKRPRALKPQVKLLENYEATGPSEINGFLETIILRKESDNEAISDQASINEKPITKIDAKNDESLNILNEEKFVHTVVPKVEENEGKKEIKKTEEKEKNEGNDEKGSEEGMKEEVIDERGNILHSKLIKDSDKIRISFWEYIQSHIWKSEALKEKIDILHEGIRRIDERLDVFKVFRKFREVDKMKLLLLENEQLVLFDVLPKPELSCLNSSHKVKESKRASHARFKEIQFVNEKIKHDLIAFSYMHLKKKHNKTMIDEKLLEIYDDILDA